MSPSFLKGGVEPMTLTKCLLSPNTGGRSDGWPVNLSVSGHFWCSQSSREDTLDWNFRPKTQIGPHLTEPCWTGWCDSLTAFSLVRPLLSFAGVNFWWWGRAPSRWRKAELEVRKSVYSLGPSPHTGSPWLCCEHSVPTPFSRSRP